MKRVLFFCIGCFFSAVLLCGLFPSVSYAEAEARPVITLGDVELKDGEYLAQEAMEPTDEAPEDHFACFKNGILTLQNFTLTGTVHCNETYLVSIIGENVLTAVEKGFSSNGSLGVVFEEGASLRVEAKSGFWALDSVLVTGGSLTIDADFGIVASGANSMGALNLMISQCDLTLRGIYGLRGESVGINQSAVTISTDGSGIFARESVFFEGSTVNITSKTGIECAGLFVNDSIADVTSTQDEKYYIKTDYAIKGSIQLGEGLYALTSDEVKDPLGILTTSVAHKKDHVKIVKKLEEFIVTFDSAGGSAVPSQKVTEGYLVNEPEPPVKDGYVFQWWVAQDKSYAITSPVNENLTFVALWEPLPSSEIVDSVTDSSDLSDVSDETEPASVETTKSSEIEATPEITDVLAFIPSEISTFSSTLRETMGERVWISWIVLPIATLGLVGLSVLLFLKKREKEQ